MFHGGVSRMLKIHITLGMIITRRLSTGRLFDKVEAERLRRAESLGRIREPEGQGEN